MIEIKKVTTNRERKAFINFGIDLYKDNPNSIPKLFIDEMDNFNEKKNPACEFSDIVQFLAYMDGKCVGRIAGIYNRRANEKWKDNSIRFTRVDFIDNKDVSAALFDAVEEWGRSLGAERVKGPMGFTDFDQQGMLVEGFEYPGNYITIYNSEYYVKHMQELGYVKEIDWIEYRLDMVSDKADRLKRLSDKVIKRSNVKLLEFKNILKLRPYIPKILEVVDEAYRNLYGVIELTDKQKKLYITQLSLVLNPEYVKLILDEKDEVIAFGFGMPSYNTALRKSRGHLFPFGWLRIILASRKKGGVLDLYLVGVKDEYKSKGIPAVLLNAMYETALKNNVVHAETGPELETNNDVQSLWRFFNSTQHIRRRCWSKSL